ncbi:MAG: hypothetical protein B7733_01150 [Myxococcales bacterium FL481]|nr:MAG: hypothetical protein B7733_01150 [Myxococcales bacterium FL481]
MKRRSAPPPAGPARAPTPAPVPVIDQRTPSSNLDRAWSFSRTEAPRPAYVEESPKTLLQINPIGYYQGVAPGSDNLPPLLSNGGESAATVLTWTGFRPQSKGSSEVFVQLSSPVAYRLDQTAQSIVITLPGTTVNVANNQRRLDTRFFNTPVDGVEVASAGPDTVIRLGLRRAATPVVSQRAAPGGYTMLILAFGRAETTQASSGATQRPTAATQAPKAPPQNPPAAPHAARSAPGGQGRLSRPAELPDGSRGADQR